MNAWRRDAACQGEPDLFFPPAGGESPDERVERTGLALEICADCPVRTECLAFAVGDGIRFGIFGGVDFGHAKRRQRAARDVSGVAA